MAESFSLASLGALLTTGTVEVRGKVYSVRALSAAQSAALRDLCPRPLPPLGKDPTKGSNAPPIAQTLDPTYQANVVAYGRKVDAMEAAVALGLAEHDAGPEVLAEAEALRRALSEAEIDRVLSVGRELTMTAEEIAQKKSSLT